MLSPLFIELRDVYAARKFGRITLAQTLALKRRVLALARWEREAQNRGAAEAPGACTDKENP